MWNALISALLLRASIVMVDGDPAWPDLDQQWRLAAETGATLIGVSPPFLMACRKAGLALGARLRPLGIRASAPPARRCPPRATTTSTSSSDPTCCCSTAAAAPTSAARFVAGPFMPPVYEGEIAGRVPGRRRQGVRPRRQRVVVGELGELVITEPMPSMPVGFWNDPGDARYRAAYFDHYPGVWRHGDWIRFTERGSCVITGRSDATLNRGGVRLGTSELYAVVEEIAGGGRQPGRAPRGRRGRRRASSLLFVVAATARELDDDAARAHRGALRAELSPRHVPDTIVAVPAIPRTLTGKKLEAPVKRILRGRRRRAGGQPRCAGRPAGDRRVRRLRRDARLI